MQKFHQIESSFLLIKTSVILKYMFTYGGYKNKVTSELINNNNISSSIKVQLVHYLNDDLSDVVNGNLRVCYSCSNFNNKRLCVYREPAV